MCCSLILSVCSVCLISRDRGEIDRRLGLPNSSLSIHVDGLSRSAPGSDTASSSGASSGSDAGKPRGLLIRGFPHRSSNSSLRDGLYHEYKKCGKVSSVTIRGSSTDRHAVVFFRRSVLLESLTNASSEWYHLLDSVDMTLNTIQECLT